LPPESYSSFGVLGKQYYPVPQLSPILVVAATVVDARDQNRFAEEAKRNRHFFAKAGCAQARNEIISAGALMRGGS
jgi:hypothetical protein